MDFSWASHFSAFWIFPLLCLLFMVVMMFGGRCMPFRFGGRARGGEDHEQARQILDRRYANGEIGKEQYDAMRRDLNV